MLGIFVMENTVEIWKDIVGYEGYYQVSSLGRVKSLDRKARKGFLKGRVLSIWSEKNKYPRISLTNSEGKEKTHTIHRLVAISFIPNPLQKLTVNHINGIKTDNRVENLEWNTLNENMKHAFDLGLLNNNKMLKGYKGELSPVHKLKDIDVLMIKCLYENGFDSSIISKRFNVSAVQVQKIVKLKSRTKN